jgi:hypothetical protein
MTESNLYKHGLPFGKDLARNLDIQMQRVHSKKASLIIIDGGVGEGKTTLAVHVADYLNKGDIDFKDQLALGGKDFMVKLRTCFTKKRIVIIYDEAGDFNRRGALTRFNALLNRVFETYRGFRIIVILVLPNSGVLDNDIFDKKIPRLLLNCWERGDKYGNYRAYSLYRMMYIRDKMKKLIVKPLAYAHTLPNFYGQFKDLTPERSKALDKISTAGKIQELKNSEVKIQGLVSYQDMSVKLACSISKVQMYLRELKVKPKKYIDKKAYYDEGIIDQLADYMDQKAEEGREKLKEVWAKRRKKNETAT